MIVLFFVPFLTSNAESCSNAEKNLHWQMISLKSRQISSQNQKSNFRKILSLFGSIVPVSMSIRQVFGKIHWKKRHRSNLKPLPYPLKQNKICSENKLIKSWPVASPTFLPRIDSLEFLRKKINLFARLLSKNQNVKNFKQTPFFLPKIQNMKQIKAFKENADNKKL